MENFSKFFDSIISGNSSEEPKASATENTNNDNNIYNSNNNINSGEPEIKVFPSEDYYLLSNEIILGATKLHGELYDSLSVPYAFVAFYMSEFAKYTQHHDYYLKKFLVLFNNKQNNIANAVNIFSRTYKEDCSIKFVNKHTHIPQLKQSYHIEISKNLSKKIIYYSDKIDNNLRTAVDNTRKIINTIDTTTSERNFKYNYLEYVSTLKTANPTVSENEPEETPRRRTRRRTVIAPPREEKEQKITSISLPVLKIGKVYPASLTHSRIDSAHFAWKFIESDRLYNIIKRYKITRVKYTKGFESKRKSLFEVKKSAFDLF